LFISFSVFKCFMFPLTNNYIHIISLSSISFHFIFFPPLIHSHHITCHVYHFFSQPFSFFLCLSLRRSYQSNPPQNGFNIYMSPTANKMKNAILEIEIQNEILRKNFANHYFQELTIPFLFISK